MSANEPVRIRRVLPDESTSAVDLIIAARHAAVPAIPPLVHTDGEVRVWFETVVMPSQDVWVAESDSDIVGVMVLGSAREENWLEQLYVAPGMTGCGIGSKLLERAKSEAGGSLDLWTFESNVGAQRFYERAGFVVVGRTDGDNEEQALDRRYRWDEP